VTTYTEVLEQHLADVKKIAESGYYKTQRHAQRFFEQHVRPAWISGMAVEEEEDIEDRFQLTPTMVRVIFLFGRCVNRIALTKSTPLITKWPPLHQSRKTDPIRCFMGLSQPSISKLVGASSTAVQEAFRRFKRSDSGGLVDRRLLNVISTEAGVVLDGVFERQTSFPFRYELDVYERGISFAADMRVASSSFHERQTSWAREARQVKFGIESIPRQNPRRKASGE